MYKLFLPFLLFALAQAQNQEITMMSPIELRHKLHANPELMFEEFETTRLLKQNIEKIPGVVIHTPTPTGLVIEYTVNSGDYLLLEPTLMHFQLLRNRDSVCLCKWKNARLRT
ncbi:MAG: hypothetical protein IPI12_09465 [Ignavibacteriales bacterium]|nr:hypothetical protein [Ignavibacteriales bacterium]